jgi:hypothetical protein
MSRKRDGMRTIPLEFLFRVTPWNDAFSIVLGLAPEQLFILREEGRLIGPHQSHSLLLPVVIKSKAPPFKERRTGHPQFPNQRPARLSNFRSIMIALMRFRVSIALRSARFRQTLRTFPPRRAKERPPVSPMCGRPVRVGRRVMATHGCSLLANRVRQPHTFCGGCSRPPHSASLPWL